MNPILQVENVTKRYAQHTALEGVSLSVPKQSVFGLLGPNGAGKTSLIRIITQITAADEGRVLFDGMPLSPKHIARMGYLPEERGLYKKMKVGEHLIYLARLKGLKEKDIRVKLKIWAERLQIDAWWHKAVEDLSKGMQQKVQFIATVLHEPELIILDEPFSGFDPVNANLIKAEILALREKGSTIIFSTHRMESVEELCDEICLINRSKKILDGKKKDIIDANKTGTYLIETEGHLTELAEHFRILSESRNEYGLVQTKAQLLQGSANDLVRAVIQQTELHGIREILPTMNEIFIRKVSE